MSVHIGNNNKIKKSNIGDKVIIKKSKEQKGFNDKHPFLAGILISLIAGFILLFSFWKEIIDLIEGWF